jgi:hypothetical protein
MTSDRLLQQAVLERGAREAAVAAGVDPGRAESWLAGDITLHDFEVSALGRALGLAGGHQGSQGVSS